MPCNANCLPTCCKKNCRVPVDILSFPPAADVYNTGLRIYEYDIEIVQTREPIVIPIPLEPTQEGQFYSLRVTNNAIVKPVHGINSVGWQFKPNIPDGFKAYVAKTSCQSNARIMSGNVDPTITETPSLFYQYDPDNIDVQWASVQLFYGGIKFFYTSSGTGTLSVQLFIRENI